MNAMRLWLLLPLARAADNGLALLPPMGWRSWNTFYADIDDAKIRSQIDALVKPRDAAGTTLHSLGYASIGIDEGWEGCKMGVNGTVHYLNGTPAVDPKRFPSMPSLVKYGHSKGVQMGFYLNGCGCNEKRELRVNYEGDVRATVAWGFDAVKIDSCGAQKNMTLYGHLFNRSGTPIQIENCHQGQNITDGGDPGQMGPGWCPYNFFRTSGDIVNLWDRVMSNLMTAVPFLSPPKVDGSHTTIATADAAPANATPTSRPGCWAYPDMLEVGRMVEHNAAESRSHFAAWAMISAPLVLGFDLSDEARMAEAWPVISNKEVIEISQTWVKGAPFPSGRLLKRWQAPNVPTIALRGGCGELSCVDQNPKCAQWAKEAQCDANPGYMHSHCAKSCDACPQGNVSGWSFSGASGGGRNGSEGTLSMADEQCLDLEGQLPPAHGGAPNVLHTNACARGASSQMWRFNRTGGAIYQPRASEGETDSWHGETRAVVVDGRGREGAPSANCMRVVSTWLWSHPVIDIGSNCDPQAPRPNEQWTLHANGTLQNAQFGCVELSMSSGPPTTIWAKPLTKGRVALLAINGADMPQVIKLDFAELIEPEYADHLGGGATRWSVRDVWAASDLGLNKGLTATVGPHDCVLLILSRPAA